MFMPVALVKSITLAAANATISPGTMGPWVEEIEQTVAEKGKFSKLTIAYIPLSPPPVFWDYKCRKCLPAGEPIVTDHGLAPIQKISVGINVLAQDGRYHRVIARGSRPYKGDIYKVRPKGSLVFRLTPDHLVLSSDGWKEIRDLHKEDAILFPIPREEEPLEYIPANLGLPGFLKVSADLLRLMGYYVAEGCVSGARSISFAFASHEEELIEDTRSIVKRIFQKKSRIQKQKDRHCTEVYVDSTWLSHWLISQCGHLANNKHFPDWAMSLPISQQTQLIKGAWFGDGHCKVDGTRLFSYTTISPTLGHQMRLLLLRQGIYSAIRGQLPRGRRQTSYLISVQRPKDFNKLAMILDKDGEKPSSWFELAVFIKDGFLYNYPWQVEVIPYEGLVYDIQVADAESFTTLGAVVHNCRFWQSPDSCQVVEGGISPGGWCAIWLPPDDKPAFSWMEEFRRGDW